MTRILYFDCFSGISGDMAVGALLDAGLPFDDLRQALGSLALGDAHVQAHRVLRAGVSATKFSVQAMEHGAPEHRHDHHDAHAPHRHDHSHGDGAHRNLEEIFHLIDHSSLTLPGRQRAKAMFQRLGEAEAAIHQMPIDRVHLHEVGAIDSIIDIVGIVHAMEWAKADRVVCSPLNVGGGLVDSAHGRFPVPAPATLRLLGDAPVYSGRVQQELVTPTGALIATTFASVFGPIPPMSIERVGYGAGDRDDPVTPNVVRVLIGREAEAARAGDRVTVIECEIDDMNPQIFGVVMERLYAAGALEVFYTSVQMKKNRPGTLLTVVAAPDRRTHMTEVIFSETTTIGLRHYEVDRECLERELVTVETPIGAVRFKIARHKGRVVNATPEFEDCAALAREKQLSVKDVQAIAIAAYGSAAVKTYFLTTAIDYVNSQPHLGTAYEKVCADVIARYRRLCGFDTRFLMGNDEHSQNVFKKAQEEGLDPLAYCDRMEQVFRRAWARLDVSFDDFIRTTQSRHKAGTTEIARRIYDAGDIYEGVYEGWYCVSCEEFKQEKDLVNGNCPLHPTLKPEWIREKNFFFRLSKYQQPLLDHFAAHPEFLQPDIRRNEILRLIESGLIDVSVSRAGQSWGIPLPWDPSSVVYVWFDALINYASAVGLGQPEHAEMFAKWWPADLHVIGKDITRFHAVIWPAMLLSAKLPLPRAIFGHGFMTINGQRMSKSLGTIIDPLVAADRHGQDPLRLYLVKEIAFGGDGDFSWERYDERYNVDLANNLGNLVSRVTAMAHRYRGGRVAPSAAGSDQLARLAETTVAEYKKAMDGFALHEGAAAAYRLIDASNEFIAATAPWTLAKDPAAADRLTQVLFDTAEAIRLAAVLLEPIIPSSSREILRRIGAPDGTLTFDRDGRWRNDGERVLLQEGPLWPRKEISVTDNPVPPDGPSPGALPPVSAPVSSSAPAPAAAPAAAQADTRITIDDFMKVELRVARVLAAEKVEKSKKLLKLSVDVGTEQRTLVAGIADAYEPESLVGRTVVIVFNLKPAKLMGIESNGMVLAASPDGGKPEVVTFAEPPAPGTRVR